MSYTYAPLAHKVSPLESTATDSRTSAESDLFDMQGSWGNQAMLSLLDATRAVVPDARGLCDAVQTEGLDALLHPFDAIDRQTSRDALAGRLSVLEPGQQPTAPNEVSPDEYAHMVDLLTDIRNDDSALGFDAGMEMLMDEDQIEAFRAGAMDDIATIMQTATGRVLLDELAYGSKTETRLRPEKDGLGPLTKVVSRELDGSQATSAEILYTPGATVQSDEAAGGPARSDIALFHELVHAWHISTGTMLPTDLLYNRLPEEHQTVGFGSSKDAPMTENAYRQERIALVGTPGEMDGDAGVHERDRYLQADDAYFGTENYLFQLYANAS